MSNSSVLFTVASWEERFLAGNIRQLKKHRCERVCIFFSKEYKSLTNKNIEKLSVFCQKRNIQVEKCETYFDDPSVTWKEMRTSVFRNAQDNPQVIVDISTMPRDQIWTIFYLLESRGLIPKFIYNSPMRYSEEWLSKDPGKPRFVYKLSGVPEFGKKTALVVITGFDIERTGRIHRYFEPSATILCIQKGQQFKNIPMNSVVHKREFSKDAEIIEIDAYGKDFGQGILEQVVERYKNKYNLVMSCLGPKLSAIAIYRLRKKYPAISLSYSPARQYNLDYSEGLGKSFLGTV